MTHKRFPNLFIVGAMKAGTSSLHEYLHQHPEIFMSRFKEPQYFAPHTMRWGQRWGQGNPFPEPGSEWYLRLFADAGDVTYAGESSVSYTARPWVTACEQRIHEFNPDARIIYILRDPIERAISHYWHFVNDGREDQDPLCAVRNKNEYLARSDYALQFQPYIDRFSFERVHVLTLEELTANPSVTLGRLFAWLGVDPHYPIETDSRLNVTAREMLQTRRGLVFVDTWLKHWRWKRVEHLMPAAVPRMLFGLSHRRIIRGNVDVQPAIDYLRPLLQERTERMTALLGRTFPEWTTLYESSGVSESASTPSPNSLVCP